MAHSPSTSTSVAAVPPKYEYLKSLSDIQCTRDLTEDAVRDILRNHTSDHGLEVSEMGSIEDMSGLNDAFNSTICRLKIEVKPSAFNQQGKSSKQQPGRQSNEEEQDPASGASSQPAAGATKEYNFVIKSPPRMSFIRQVHKLSRPFFNEVSWYLDLVPQLELVHGKGTIDHILPTCYHAYSSYYSDHEGQGTCCTNTCPWWCWLPFRRSEQGVLILENITMREGKSYKMVDKRKPVPLPHIKLIFAELAHFHGKWLRWIQACKNGNLKKSETSDGGSVEPITWKTFQNTYNTQKRIPSFLYQQLKNVAKKTTIKMLKKHAEGLADSEAKKTVEENISKCKTFFDRSSMRMLNEYMSKEPSEIFTLCHGDFWSNNIMFNYKDEAEVEPQDLIIIDYQLINYGHPAYDLVYFVYLNTDLEFRDAHLKDVLRIYYDIFVKYLAESYPEKTYSFDDFVADFNYHKPVGFTTACSVMPNVMSNTQVDLETAGIMALRELQRKQEQELNDESNPSSQEIRRRIVQMVEEMVRDNVI